MVKPGRWLKASGIGPLSLHPANRTLSNSLPPARRAVKSLPAKASLVALMSLHTSVPQARPTTRPAARRYTGGHLLWWLGSRYYTGHMSTVQTWQTTCTGLDETLRLAAAVGRKLRGGEVIELVSDLGGGKTTFVRGLAKGTGSKDLVSSPSFTLSNQYKAGPLTLYHFDFYRLSEPGIMRDELAEVLADPQAVVIVEWANVVERVLPAKRLTITMKATSVTARELTFTYPEQYKYLLLRNT